MSHRESMLYRDQLYSRRDQLVQQEDGDAMPVSDKLNRLMQVSDPESRLEILWLRKALFFTL